MLDLDKLKIPTIDFGYEIENNIEHYLIDNVNYGTKCYKFDFKKYSTRVNFGDKNIGVLLYGDEEDFNSIQGLFFVGETDVYVTNRLQCDSKEELKENMQKLWNELVDVYKQWVKNLFVE